MARSTIRTTSEADTAYKKFLELVANNALFSLDHPKLSEADTRAKLIDPLFRDVLGWTELEIRREKPAAEGYADYVLGSDFTYLLIEAKRTKPRFHLGVSSRARKLQMAGPHLLGQKKVKPILEQARNYATDLGAQFALATNGSQFILFRPYLPGKSWSSGIAFAWHDHDDIKNDFAEFFRLLSRDSVQAGALFEAFEEEESITAQLFTPIDYIQNPDRELVRNQFWSKISSVLGPLLADRPEDRASQEEIIQHCYVTTPLSDEADKNLDALLRDRLPKTLANAGVVDIAPSGRSAFSAKLEKDVWASRPGTYILTGGVGSGKTTFLKRFARITGRRIVEHYCVWLHVDFLPVGNVEIMYADSEIRTFSFRVLRERLQSEYPQYAPSTGNEVRELFAAEIQQASITSLFGMEPNSPEWQQGVNELVAKLFGDDEKYVFSILIRLRKRGLRPVVVLDNTDQLGEAFQERVFLFAQRLADQNVLCVVALREEKFFAAYRRGIFDAYGDRSFHIGSPDLHVVLRKRLHYGREKFAQLAEEGELSITTADARRVDKLLRTLIRSTTQKNSNIIRMLACVSNGDMRHALDLFREFVGSGNTNVEKILSIGETYSVSFHEFAKSAILGSRKFYRSSVSHIVNVFVRSASRGSSHLAAARVLARLSAAQGVASVHGEGFVETSKLLREYRESFGIADDFVSWAEELLRRGLVDSEPPRQGELTQTDALRITAAGAYYWNYLVRSFAYLDLVFIDTPIADKSLARRLADAAESTNMLERFERVSLFLTFLGKCEADELIAVSRRSGPYASALIPEIRSQIEKEMSVIRRKVRL